MRKFATINSRFWIGSTGRELRRAGPIAQLVALYLITCPSSTMIGLFYLPRVVLEHETGLTTEQVSTALADLDRVGFARYDEATETVFVLEMARFQIAPELHPKDKRVQGVRKELEQFTASPFHEAFLEKYGHVFHLNGEAPFKPLRRGSRGATKPHRSQEQDQEQDQEQEKNKKLVRSRDTRSRRIPADNLVDERFVSELQRDPAYAGIDVRKELGRMDAWLRLPKNRAKARSKSRLLNWLNRAEPSRTVNQPQERGEFDHLYESGKGHTGRGKYDHLFESGKDVHEEH